MLSIRAIRCYSVLGTLVACTHTSTLSKNAAVITGVPATVTISGRVTSSDGSPLAGAGVSISGSDRTTRTDADGKFTLTEVAVGPSELIVSQAGYATTRVAAKFSTKPSDNVRNHVDVTLFTPEETDGFIARAGSDSAILWKVGFLHRQASVRDAYFVTPEAIDSMQPLSIADIFRHVPVMIDNPNPSGRQRRGGCSITYVDGIARSGAYRQNIDTYVPVKHVLAAEVYPPGQDPPPPFARGSGQSNCATVGIWTRG